MDGKRIQITDAQKNIYDYELKKFLRSNNSTSINQRPAVSLGQKVSKGDVIADSSAVDHGELELGQNVLVAFMAWDGYNYEDAVIISERLVHDDALYVGAYRELHDRRP